MSLSEKIYFWSSAEKQPGYLGVKESDQEKIDWYDDFMGVPLPNDFNDWKPPKLEQYLGEKKKRKLLPIGDAPTSVATNLISESAAKSLKDILDMNATLYPVSLMDDLNNLYYMVVCHTELNCLDRESSEGTLTVQKKNPEFFSVLENWVFYKDCLKDNHMFVLPDSKNTIYVSEYFKQRVIEEGLKGFCFKTEFWEDKPFIS